MSNSLQQTPNHALQRTATGCHGSCFSRSGVSPSSCIATGLGAFSAAHLRSYRASPPRSLSLGSLGDFAHLLRVMNAQQDIPSPVPSSKLHGLKTSSFESIASQTVQPSVASRLFLSRRFQSSQASIASESDSAFARRLSRGGRVHAFHTQQLRAPRHSGGFWLSSSACARPSPSFPDIHARASIASPGVTPGTLFGRLS